MAVQPQQSVAHLGRLKPPSHSHRLAGQGCLQQLLRVRSLFCGHIQPTMPSRCLCHLACVLPVAFCAVVQDDMWEHQGAHVFLPGGNLRLLQGLAKDVPILYKTPAQLIQHCSQGVRQQQE